MLSNVKIGNTYFKIEVEIINKRQAFQLDIRSDRIRGIGKSADYSYSGICPSGEPISMFPVRGLWVQFEAAPTDSLTRTLYGSNVNKQRPIKGYFVKQS